MTDILRSLWQFAKDNWGITAAFVFLFSGYAMWSIFGDNMMNGALSLLDLLVFLFPVVTAAFIVVVILLVLVAIFKGGGES